MEEFHTCDKINVTNTGVTVRQKALFFVAEEQAKKSFYGVTLTALDAIKASQVRLLL